MRNNNLPAQNKITSGIKKLTCIALFLASLQLAAHDNKHRDTNSNNNDVTAVVPVQKNMLLDVSKQLQQVLDTVIVDERANFPGVILRIESANGVWNGVAGVNDLQSKEVIEPQAKFRAGSILKPFISTVILQLMEEGKLALTDTLPQLLPAKISELFEYNNDITLKMLLNHTSGIADWVGNDYEKLLAGNQLSKVWQDSELLNMAAKMGSNFKPGERYEYNNTEYTLLGLIIEEKTDVSWRENIRQRIFTKLKLQNTSLPEPGNMKMSGSFVHGYEKFSTGIIDTTEIDPSMAGAAGGHALVTNTQDLSIFIQALLNGEFFSNKETLTTMLTGVDTGQPGLTYGLGIDHRVLPNGSYAYGHTGSTAGYASFIFHFPEQGITASSVITTDQGSAIPFYLYPSLEIVAKDLLKNH